MWPSAQHGPNAEQPTVRRQNPIRGAVPGAAVSGERRCPIHGGAARSGAPINNRSALKHRLFTRETLSQRKAVNALLRRARAILEPK